MNKELKNENTMSQRSQQKHAARERREEQKADRVVKGIFIGLIVLAVVAMIAYSVLG